MSVEQVRLIELILYYKIKATNKMENIITQIKNKQTLKEIDIYIRQNHTMLDQEQLEKYLEQILKQTKLIEN